MYLKINKNNFAVNFSSKPRYSLTLLNRYKIYFFGFFRTPFASIKENIENLNIKEFTNENVEKIFQKINGICTILIVDNQSIKVCLSIYHPFLKVFNSKDEYIVTDREFDESNKISNTKSFLKVFSHHGYFIHDGLSENVIDFVPPGGMIEFKKDEIKDYDFSWYLNFENFCSRDDHDKIVEDLTENYYGVFDGLDNKKKYYFGLSAGLDSAVALGAAVKKGLNITPFHKTRGMYSDELKATNGTSKFLGKDLTKIYKWGKKYTALGYSDDITDNLEFNYDYIKKDSTLFFSYDFIEKKEFPDAHIFLGAGDPLLLTIHHFMVYSDRIRKNFGYDLNRDKRYFFSKDFFENFKNQKKLKLKNEDVFLKEFHNIDPRYIPLFQSFTDQLTKLYDYRSKFFGGDTSIKSKDASPIKDISYDQAKLLKDLKLKRSILLIKKILTSKFFSEKLRDFDARTSSNFTQIFSFSWRIWKRKSSNFYNA